MLLRYKLQNPDIVAENVYPQRKLVDYQGTCFAKDFETDVDFIAEDGNLLVFEVNSTVRASDVGIFALQVNLVREQNPQKRVRGLFISPLPTPEVREQCERYGLQLLKVEIGDVTQEALSRMGMLVDAHSRMGDVG